MSLLPDQRQSVSNIIRISFKRLSGEESAVKILLFLVLHVVNMLIKNVLMKVSSVSFVGKELDGPAVSAPQREIAEVKQNWLVIGWVTIVDSTHQPALGSRGGLWPVLLMCNP
jgi:hypothetical protein